MACYNWQAAFFAESSEGMVYVMSIKKCLLSLFMTMLLVIMIAGCMSGNDLSNMECVSKNTSTMEAVAEKSADASMPNREKSNENRTTQVSADRSVIEESSVETDTETLNAPTEVSTEMLSNIPTETTAPIEATEPAEDIQPITEASKPTETESATETPKPAESEPAESKPVEDETPEPIIYDPYQVVNLVIAKCVSANDKM